MLGRTSAAAIVALTAALTMTGPPPARAQAPDGRPTVEEARSFVTEAEQRLLDLSTRAGRAAWVQANFITDDTERIAADLNKDLVSASMALAKAATRFDGMTLPPDIERKLMFIKLGPLPLAAPSDPKLQSELTQIAASMDAMYGKGKYCPGGNRECMDINAVTKVMAESRNPGELLDVWRGWHTISPPMKPKYTRFVELANAGARELNFKDLGAMWRSAYDMPPDAFAAELDRL